MAATGIAATGLLRLNYEVDNLPHQIDFFANVDEISVGNWRILPNVGAVTQPTGGTVGQIFWDLVRPLYPAAVLAPSWTLFQRIVNIYVPRASGSLTGVGTAATAYQTAGQATLTFRNDQQVLMRVQLMETVLGYPDSRPLPTSEANIAALTTSYTDNPDDTNLSSFITARDGNAGFFARYFSSDINQKVRRARGV